MNRMTNEQESRNIFEQWTCFLAFAMMLGFSLLLLMAGIWDAKAQNSLLALIASGGLSLLMFRLAWSQVTKIHKLKVRLQASRAEAARVEEEAAASASKARSQSASDSSANS